MFFDTPEFRRFSELDGKTFVVCVGAMKCATSWIYYYLGALPGVTVSPLKELHFFNAKYPSYALGDMEALAIKRVGLHLGRDGDPVENLLCSGDFQASVDRMQMIYDDNAYFGHFARLCTPETQTLCDVTPAYAVIGPDGFAFMKTFFAAQDVRLKLVYVMRDPVERLWSQLRHLQEINPAGEIAMKWEKAIKSSVICARADYSGTIKDLDATFSADEILYLFYEDLFTEATLRRLCAFADADFQPGEADRRRNKTQVELDLPEDARDAFLRLLAPQYAFCRERFGDQVPASWVA